MLRKVACVVAVFAFCVSVAAAEDFFGVIKKVDGNKITVAKIKGFGKNAEVGEDMVLKSAAGIKVAKGKFNFKEKKVEVGDPLEGGLSNKLFKDISEKGVRARITTDGDQITQILIFQRKGKGKGKKTN